MCGIATDGAAVMVGSRSGLTTRFKELVPGLPSTHCIAHRLALCSSGAADAIPYLIKYQELVNCIYKYFSNSPKNLCSLEKIQAILASVNADSGTRLKQISNTRWLSFEGSVTALLRNYSSLITVLLEDNSPKTVGLLKSITCFKFLYITHFLSDVLPILCRLSKCYQRSDIVFSNVNPLLASTISQLQGIETGNYGINVLNLLDTVPTAVNVDRRGSFFVQ
ncbi:hypothetical protein SNE40_013682 [Patella caerulea]|uniref:Uncharacterized protein n=1 Tax=Patella caerulea TaxID=87958 RepID=A0AAN8JGM1_PATCE